MEFLKKLRGWLGILSKFFGWLLPPQIKLIVQAVLVGFDAFLVMYKTVRKEQASRMKKAIKDTATKIKDPRLTLEERLKLNAEMESHFKHFVDSTTTK